MSIHARLLAGVDQGQLRLIDGRLLFGAVAKPEAKQHRPHQAENAEIQKMCRQWTTEGPFSDDVV